MPDASLTTVVPVDECPDCGERLLERRCPDCHRFTRRIGSGGCCPACGETVTLDELREAATI